MIHHRNLIDLSLSSKLINAWSRNGSSIGCHPRGMQMAEKEEKEENEQMVNEEDEQGNILVDPAWSEINAPKAEKSKWEVPIYM